MVHIKVISKYKFSVGADFQSVSIMKKTLCFLHNRHEQKCSRQQGLFYFYHLKKDKVYLTF